MTRPLPIRRPNNLLLPLHKRVHRAHPVLLLRAAFDAGERDDAVVHDDANLLAGEGSAFEDCVMNSFSFYEVRTEQQGKGRTLELHICRKRRKLRYLERPFLWDVVCGQRPLRRKRRQVQRREDCAPCQYIYQR